MRVPPYWLFRSVSVVWPRASVLVKLPASSITFLNSLLTSVAPRNVGGSARLSCCSMNGLSTACRPYLTTVFEIRAFTS